MILDRPKRFFQFFLSNSSGVLLNESEKLSRSWFIRHDARTNRLVRATIMVESLVRS